MESAILIRPGVTILLSKAEVLECALLSTGIRRVELGDLKEASYRPGSIVPDEPLHALELRDLDILCRPDKEPGAWVKTIEITAEAVDVFHFIRANCYAGVNHHDLTNFDLHPDFHDAVKLIERDITPYVRPESNIVLSQSIGVHEAGRLTITQDYQREGRFSGIHLDSWFPMSLRKRAWSPNRIVVNLGHEARWFVFANLTVQQMAAELGLDDTNDAMPDTAISAIGRDFLRKNPAYPIVFLKIAPGHAYIAPTENIYHDGSSIGQNTADITLSFIGDFQDAPRRRNTPVEFTTSLETYVARRF